LPQLQIRHFAVIDDEIAQYVDWVSGPMTIPRKKIWVPDWNVPQGSSKAGREVNFVYGRVYQF